jgi:uncharacterized repeat protein (TIGR01451 family)
MNKKTNLFTGICVISLLFCLITSLFAGNHDVMTSWHVFPGTASNPKASKLLIERRVPRSITPDQEYTFQLKVTNQSLYKIDHVVIIENLPENFSFISAQPAPEVKENTLTWKLGMMAPRQKEILIIKGKAIKSGTIDHTGKAIVAYNLGNITTVMDVVEAKISMALDYTKNAVVTDTIPVRITLSNLGTANVEDAKLLHKFSKGLTTASGASSITENIGTILPNETATLNLALKASARGKYSENLIIKAKDGVQADATLNLIVGKPNLFVIAKAPKKRFVGNRIRLELNIKNKGDAIAKSTRTVLNVPQNTKFLSATQGGGLHGNQVIWELGSLKPDKERKLTVTLEGKVISNLSTTATTTAHAADTVTSNFKTQIAGIPALLISLSDVNDPVPVGSYETYNITISNQGSLAAKDVVVKCILESSMQYVGVKGPTGKQSIENNILILKPLPNIAPDRSAAWQVTVKALKAGDVRFEVYTESKQLTRPVFENESTHFYND